MDGEKVKEKRGRAIGVKGQGQVLLPKGFGVFSPEPSPGDYQGKRPVRLHTFQKWAQTSCSSARSVLWTWGGTVDLSGRMAQQGFCDSSQPFHVLWRQQLPLVPGQAGERPVGMLTVSDSAKSPAAHRAGCVQAGGWRRRQPQPTGFVHAPGVPQTRDIV